MSYNNDVYKLEIGDLVERITWDSFAKKLGVVVAIALHEIKEHDLAVICTVKN